MKIVAINYSAHIDFGQELFVFIKVANSLGAK